ncbi:MAG: hypothetical protein ACK5HL_01545 [Bacilli bacterium]
MLSKIFFFLLGFGFTLIGFMYIILYLNLLSMGYNFLEYVNFITGRIECYFSIIGVVIISIVLRRSGGKYELYI